MGMISVKRSSGWRNLIKWLLRGSGAWLTLVLAAILLPGFAQAQPGPAYDLQNIIKNGVLRVAVTRFDLPAFHWRENGELQGPEIEFARQIARALEIKIEFVDTPDSFNGVVDAVAAGDADIGISKLSQTYLRLTRVRFSRPYITLRHGLLFDRQTISAGSDGRAPDAVIRVFQGRIGVIQRSAYVDFGKRKFPDARIVEAANWNTAIDDLLAHRVDAIYRDEFEIRRVLKNRPALNVGFGIAIATDQQDFLSIAVCKSCAMLQEFVNYHITQAEGVFTIRNLLAADLHDR